VNGTAQFSSVTRLADLNKRLTLVVALAVGAVVPLAIVMVILVFGLTGSRLGANRWDWHEYVLVSALLVPIGCVVLVLARRWQRRRIHRQFQRWLEAATRSSAERAGVDFYLALIASREAGRAAAVARFLEAVPADESRTLAVCNGTVVPVDDGTLSEESDAFEGRAKNVSRWLLVAITAPFTLQFVSAVMANGVNPARWSGYALLMALPVIFNIVLMLYALGVLRPPGTVVLVTPRRVQRSTVRGTQVFTPDDTVMVVAAVHRNFIVAFYRNDGKMAGVQYPSLETPGFKQLINRWCMTPAQHPQTPAPADTLV
jgi:hypothetical protein